MSFVKLSCSFIDEEAKKGPKRRGAPRSAGRTAANTGPVSFETLPDVLIIMQLLLINLERMNIHMLKLNEPLNIGQIYFSCLLYKETHINTYKLNAEPFGNLLLTR